jgi:hypothetical protein
MTVVQIFLEKVDDDDGRCDGGAGRRERKVMLDLVFYSARTF